MIKPGLKCEICEEEQDSIFKTDIYGCDIPGCVILHRVCHSCMIQLIRTALNSVQHQNAS